MRHFLICNAVLVLTASVTTTSQAGFFASTEASANDVESGNGNSESHTGFSTSNAAYFNPGGGSASAFAASSTNGNGGVDLKASASGTGGDTFFRYNRGSASATWQDDVHFSGTLLEVGIDFRFEVDGTASGDTSVTAGVVICRDNGSSNECGPPSTLSGPGTILIAPPYLIEPSETVTISYSLNVVATGHPNDGGPAESTADFSHTMKLVSITPRDSSGNIVPGITITSDSGVDYNPLLIYNQVPEPSTLTLFGLLLILVSASVRSRPAQ